MNLRQALARLEQRHRSVRRLLRTADDALAARKPIAWVGTPSSPPPRVFTSTPMSGPNPYIDAVEHGGAES